MLVVAFSLSRRQFGDLCSTVVFSRVTRNRKSEVFILIQKISHLKSPTDLATYLNISLGYLYKISNYQNKYTSFTISKKSGGERTIYKPINELAVIQHKLKLLIQDSCRISNRAYGFTSGKSFIDNAKNHIRKKYVFNLDLENFFESITSPRIYSLFNRYFNLSKSVAMLLTNLCSHPNGFLPQGSPTSPIISNIICKSLDIELVTLAKSVGNLYYSRYADDITFSSNSSKFPEAIACLNNNQVVLSKTLVHLISKNGFVINQNKVRLQDAYMHQEVTGITVNKKVNLNRRFLKKIRAILYSLKNTYESQEGIENFFKVYDVKGKSFEIKLIRAFQILKGKINYVGDVKGKDDSIYKDFVYKFNELINIYKANITTIKRETTSEIYFMRNTVVIDPFEKDYYPTYYSPENGIDIGIYGQGSGFNLKGIGIITNYHVIEDLINDVLVKGMRFTKGHYIQYFMEFNGEKIKKYGKLKYWCKDADIAIIESKDSEDLNIGYNFNKYFNMRDKITLLGFPDHSFGSVVSINEGEIKRKLKNSPVSTYEISAKVFSGNSGGPILNYKNEVIGIANKGFTIRGVVPSQFIPIKYALEVNIEKKQNPPIISKELKFE